MMTSAEREFALELLDQSRDRVLHIVEGLSVDQFLYKPAAERWSVAENVEHLVAVENALLAAVERLLSAPPDVEGKCALTDHELVQKVTTITERVQAPERALPKSRWRPEELPGQFVDVRGRTREFTRTTEGDLRKHFFPHFVFGNLDCYQWLLLIGAHAHRHCEQIDALKASANFPVTAGSRVKAALG